MTEREGVPESLKTTIEQNPEGSEEEEGAL